MTSMRDDPEAEGATSPIEVSAAARAAMERLIEANGDILFHLPGGCCDARTPVCLPVGELQLGPRDKLVGYADGAPVYEMAGDGDRDATRAYRLDVVDGVPVGFSLSPGDAKCFSLRDARDTGARG